MTVKGFVLFLQFQAVVSTLNAPAFPESGVEFRIKNELVYPINWNTTPSFAITHAHIGRNLHENEGAPGAGGQYWWCKKRQD